MNASKQKRWCWNYEYTHTHARTHARKHPHPHPHTHTHMLSLQQNLVQIWTKIDKIYRPICRQSPTYTETTQLILIANCVQNNCGRMTFQVKIQVTGLSHYLHLHRSFSLFHTFCNQLPDFSVIGTLAANALKPNIFNKMFAKLCQEQN